jgi:molybdate transport system substrate-binding protein
MSGQEIMVVSSGSGEPALDHIAADFEKATGYRVRITYDDKVTHAHGVAFDVVVASADAIEREFRPSGSVEEGGTILGSMGIGVTIRRGAPVPDIASLEALKQSLLETAALLVTTHTSGLYMESMIRKMGIHERIAGKIERFRNAPLLMDRLLEGTGSEFAFLSINQVRRYEEKGLVLAGPLPDEVQYFREFVAVPISASRNKEAAWAFVRYCGGPGRAVLAANGFSQAGPSPSGR